MLVADMSASDLAAVIVAIASVVAVVLLIFIVVAINRTLTTMRMSIEELRRETLPVVDELAPLRDGALDGHPWAAWADAITASGSARMPGGLSRWSQGKDLSWEPLRPERVVEVAYEHLQGDRFRHAARFRRWRPDRDPSSCTYAQLETPTPELLANVFGT